jgi:hypothetical protein
MHAASLQRIPKWISKMDRQHSEEVNETNTKAENGSSVVMGTTTVLQHIFKRGHAALEMLYEAAVYAQDVNHSVWDFSLEIGLLREGGLAHSDLRWLLCKGLLEQAGEIISGDSQTRRFHAKGSLSFSRSSCFVLTEAGQSFVRQSLGGIIAPCDESIALPMTTNQFHADADSLRIKPFWDRDRQELRVGAQIVKQFKVPAPNQEIVLAAFHEENWPVRIDDPLPPRPDLEPKRRLHDTINSLNRNQKSELMRFLGDGSGQGVRWEFGMRSSMPVQIHSSLT